MVSLSPLAQPVHVQPANACPAPCLLGFLPPATSTPGQHAGWCYVLPFWSRGPSMGMVVDPPNPLAVCVCVCVSSLALYPYSLSSAALCHVLFKHIFGSTYHAFLGLIDFSSLFRTLVLFQATVCHHVSAGVHPLCIPAGRLHFCRSSSSRFTRTALHFLFLVLRRFHLSRSLTRILTPSSPLPNPPFLPPPFSSSSRTSKAKSCRSTCTTTSSFSAGPPAGSTATRNNPSSPPFMPGRWGSPCL